ncbi:MAG: hypothetical protein ACLQFR_29930 [Streptosporangiaceae bacterium]
MNWITNLAGSGAGVIAIAAGLLILRYLSRAPQIVHPWLHRFVIVLMYAGGAALAVTTIGSLADKGVVLLAGWFGGLNYGLVHAILVIAVMVLLAGTVMALIWDPDAPAAIVAVFLPVLLALPFGGLIHQVYATLNAPALSLAAGLNHLLAG